MSTGVIIIITLIVWTVLGFILCASIPNEVDHKLNNLAQGLLILCSGPFIWLLGLCFGTVTLCKRMGLKEKTQRVFYKKEFQPPRPEPKITKPKKELVDGDLKRSIKVETKKRGWFK